MGVRCYHCESSTENSIYLAFNDGKINEYKHNVGTSTVGGSFKISENRKAVNGEIIAIELSLSAYYILVASEY